MKKIIPSIVLAMLLAAPVMVLAQPSESVPDYQGTELIDVLKTFIDWLFTILLIVAVVFLIIAAFTFVTASGDPAKVDKARSFVLYALIGVAIAVAARGLVALVRVIMSP